MCLVLPGAISESFINVLWDFNVHIFYFIFTFFFLLFFIASSDGSKPSRIPDETISLTIIITAKLNGNQSIIGALVRSWCASSRHVSSIASAVNLKSLVCQLMMILLFLSNIFIADTLDVDRCVLRKILLNEKLLMILSIPLINRHLIGRKVTS